MPVAWVNSAANPTAATALLIIRGSVDMSVTQAEHMPTDAPRKHPGA